MKQKIAKAPMPLIGMGTKSVHGLDLFEEAVGVKQNTKTAVSANVDATEKAQNECKAAKTALQIAREKLAATNALVGTKITLARDLLKPTLGSRYSVRWNEVGFVNNSLKVPGSSDERLGLLKMIQLYLDAHPELESPGVVTAVMLEDLHSTYATDLTAAAIAATTLRQKTEARDVETLALERRLRGLFQELKRLLSPHDARWLEFGFNVPGDPTTPKAPEDLAVTPGLPGHLSASWTSPVGANRFRVFRKVAGQDDKFMAAASTAETAIELDNLTSGAHVQLYVTAINEAGESLPSDIVEVVVP